MLENISDPYAATGGRDAICDSPSSGEPLRYDTDGADVEKRAAPPEQQALGEKEMPGAIGKACGDQGRGFEHYANEQSSFRPQLLG